MNARTLFVLASSLFLMLLLLCLQLLHILPMLTREVVLPRFQCAPRRPCSAQCRRQAGAAGQAAASAVRAGSRAAAAVVALRPQL